MFFFKYIYIYIFILFFLRTAIATGHPTMSKVYKKKKTLPDKIKWNRLQVHRVFKSSGMSNITQNLTFEIMDLLAIISWKIAFKVVQMKFLEMHITDKN